MSTLRGGSGILCPMSAEVRLVISPICCDIDDPQLNKSGNSASIRSAGTKNFPSGTTFDSEVPG